MQTLNEILVDRFTSQPQARALRYLHDGTLTGPIETWSYGDLGQRVTAIAAALQGRCAPGDRVLLVYPPGPDFVAGFFGCLLAGVIAVPSYPPDPSRLELSLERLVHVAADCTPALVLTTAMVTSLAGAVGDSIGLLASIPWLATDTLDPDMGSAWVPPEVGPQTLAFLQYTSGSTRHPAGVMVSHGNLVANLRQQATVSGLGPDDSFCSWLPMFHDMGLIGPILFPVFLGTDTVLMSPMSFLRDPMCWLTAVSQSGATVTAAPNFAFDLLLRKATDADVASLDLSRWRICLNGAERVRAATVEDFVARFAPAGFRRSTMLLAYGLAEATVFVAGAPLADDVQTLQSPSDGVLLPCGPPGPDMQVQVVDPHTRTPTDGFGELWLRGPNVARGYWGHPQGREGTFDAQTADGDGPWLRTGDLGSVVDGQIYVGGRLKDLVIVRGRNLCPEDLEHTAQSSHRGVRPGGVVALGVERDGEEQLVIVAERNRRHPAPAEDIAAAVRAAVAEAHSVQVSGFVLVDSGLPKTSSGKLQRSRTADLLKAGELSEHYRSFFAHTTPQIAWEGDDRESVERWIIARIAAVTGATVDADTPFAELGVDSVQATELAAELEAALGRPVPVTTVFDHPSASALASALFDEPAATAEPAPTGGGVWDALDAIEEDARS